MLGPQRALLARIGASASPLIFVRRSSALPPLLFCSSEDLCACLSQAYGLIATAVTTWENHQKQGTFERVLTLRIFFFTPVGATLLPRRKIRQKASQKRDTLEWKDDRRSVRACAAASPLQSLCDAESYLRRTPWDYHQQSHRPIFGVVAACFPAHQSFAPFCAPVRSSGSSTHTSRSSGWPSGKKTTTRSTRR